MLQVPKIYEHLKEIRSRIKVGLKLNDKIRQTIVNDYGDESEFFLRNYQSIGVYHLLTMKRFLLGDDTGLGKTIETLSTLAYLWAKDTKFKAIIVAPKSALIQWEKEMERFLVDLRGIRSNGTPAKRQKIYEDFFNGNSESKFALILNYHVLARDWDVIRPFIVDEQVSFETKKGKKIKRIKYTTKTKVVTVFDEATAFKNPKTKVHDICYQLSQISERVYGLTATMLKNNLMEGYGIFRVIVPGLFRTKTSFTNDFCHTKLIPVKTKSEKRRNIPLIVGYKNLNKFRCDIDPYFLGRAKTDVSTELPDVITKKILLELTLEQEKKYGEALSGLLFLDDEIKETTKLTSMIYCQQIVDSLHLLGLEGSSQKEDELFRILEHELSGEKVIVYTNFRKMVDRLVVLLSKKGIPYTRITGAENKDMEREKNKTMFQDPNSGVNLILITNAGSAAINLQAASALIFFDSPWSYGDYKQLLGRMVRIGSVHQTVLALHFVVQGTIDVHVLKTLKNKKKLIDPILGGSKDTLSFDSSSEMTEIYKALREDAKEYHGK